MGCTISTTNLEKVEMISDDTKDWIDKLQSNQELFANIIKVLVDHIIGSGRAGETNDLNITAEMLRANQHRILEVSYNSATAMHNIELGPKND